MLNSQFSGLPKFEPHPTNPGEFVLLEEFGYAAPGGLRVVIPPGFITDFASTPQILHALPWFDPLREAILAALPHDWLYCTQSVPRAVADGVLRSALIDSGVSKTLAYTYWLGVRAGGWRPWNARLRRGGGLQADDFMSVP